MFCLFVYSKYHLKSWIKFYLPFLPPGAVENKHSGDWTPVLDSTSMTLQGRVTLQSLHVCSIMIAIDLINVCMYVCMYVCKCICIYICICICKCKCKCICICMYVGEMQTYNHIKSSVTCPFWLSCRFVFNDIRCNWRKTLPYFRISMLFTSSIMPQKCTWLLYKWFSRSMQKGRLILMIYKQTKPKHTGRPNHDHANSEISFTCNIQLTEITFIQIQTEHHTQTNKTCYQCSHASNIAWSI